MAGPVLGMALGILVLAMPFIVILMLVVVLISGIRLIVRGAAGRIGSLILGTVMVAGCLTALGMLRTWSQTCPAEGAGKLDPHRVVYEQMALVRGHAWATEATRRGTVIGMKLGGDPCDAVKARHAREEASAAGAARAR